MKSKTTFHKLFEPIKIGNIVIKNRIAMAPMSIIGLCNPDGTFSERAIDYYVERAKGDVGLIITGNIKVENEIEKTKITIKPIISLNPSHFVQTASELVEAVHAFGTKIFAQLTAGFGRVARPSTLITHPIAPSTIPNFWDPSLICKELTLIEIKKLIDSFKEAAYLIATAGFDGIEIHGVHEGYLIDQFATALWNKRADEYGGNLEGRLRFPIEILHAIKDEIGKEFPVSMRLSLKSYIKNLNEGGLPNEDFEEAGRDINEGLEIARILEREGYDAFNVDAGSYEAWYWAHPPTYMPYGCYLDLAQKLKETVKVPVLVAGKMNNPELAEEALIKGKADIIVLGRALLADPEWPIKVREGRIEDIRPCIGCHVGCLGRIIEGKSLSCAVNPMVGKEKLHVLRVVNEPKRVLVIGGGVAGMEAARIAAMRGHKVTLYEKRDSLGGHLIEASVPSFKRDLKSLIRWYEIQLQKVGVNVILNKEVTPELVENEDPDVVIVATGSKPLVPGIEGIEKPHVVTCIDLLLGKKSAGKTIVIAGGGLIGCETALWLAEQGKEVAIIEKLPDLMIAGLPVPRPNKIMLQNMLKAKKVRIVTNAVLRKIIDDRVIIEIEGEMKEIYCDTVVLALGLKPERKLYDSLHTYINKPVYMIGDCKEPRRIFEAIREGFIVASMI
jgi:2-enoate reductase